nr:hypothetical protein [Tanacetum cinerariifolium]
LHICPRIPNQTFDEILFEEEILAFLRYLGRCGEINKITDVNINKLHQPWRSFAAVISKCLSGKSTGYDSLSVDPPAPEVIAPIDKVVAPKLAESTGSPSSTTVDQDAPSPSKSQTTLETQPPIIPHDVEEGNHDIEVAHMGNDPLFGMPIPEVVSDQSSSTDSTHTIVHPDHQISQHNRKWTKDHLFENLIGQLARPVSTRLQLHEQALFCYYDSFLTSVELKTYKDALTQSWWIEAMQEELNMGKRSLKLKVINRTIHITIDQQVALDEALIPHASRLRIGKRNFHLRSDITSNESTLQLVYDVLRLTPFYKAFLVTADAQILWGMYHKKNVDFAYLLWEDFVYQVEHKYAKKSNEMCYPRNFEAYKEYYAIASGAAPTKTKASVRKTKSSSDTTITPPTVVGTRLSTLAKGKQPANQQQTRISQASGSGADEGTSIIPGVLDAPTDKSDEEISWKSSDEDDDDEVDDKIDDQDDNDDDQDDDDQDDNNDDQDTDNNGDDFIHPKLSIHEEEAKDEKALIPSEEGQDAEDDDEELYTDVNVNREVNSPVDVQASTIVALTAPTLPPPTIPTISQFAGAVSSIPGIFERYIDQWMNEAIKIIKEQVKDQVKVQVSNILPKIEKTVNKQLEAEFLTRSSNSSKTSYAAASDLSEMELKKILIEKMESNKHIWRYSMLKRHRDDADKEEEPSARSDQGSKRRREGKEPESTTAPKEQATKTTSKSTKGSKSHQKTASEVKQESSGARIFLEEVYKATTNQLDWNNPEGQRYPHNLLKPLPLIPNSRGRRVIPFDHFINNDLEYLRGDASSRGVKNWSTMTNMLSGESLIEGTNVNSSTDLQSTQSLLEMSTQNIELSLSPNFKSLNGMITSIWIGSQCVRDDDKLHKFKEGDFKRLRIQDIEDMLLLLVQGKLTNLTVEERFAFNVSLRMFTRSIVIQRRMKDLQLGVESYQKKLSLTKPDTYHSDLKHKEAYTAYSNPRGFIYKNKNKQNRLMWIDELHKFSDGTLNDVRTALDDHLKGIRMKYLPQAIWRRSDKERAAAMIQAIDKQLKTRRIMRSLEKFIGGRLYEGDIRMLQRII